MYLVDSNICLEYLLNQEKRNECKEFLKVTDDALIFISEFTLYSIGIITTKINKSKVYEEFIIDTFETGGVKLRSLEINDHKKLVYNMKSFKLDFDDGYQLTCANKHNLTLVSFDTDFDRTSIKRFEPKDLIT